MTEKRTPVTPQEVCDLYNKLLDENKELKQDILRLCYTAEHLIDYKKYEKKYGIDYNQFKEDLFSGKEHL